jgi:hypothetical protein
LIARGETLHLSKEWMSPEYEHMVVLWAQLEALNQLVGRLAEENYVLRGDGTDGPQI